MKTPEHIYSPSCATCRDEAGKDRAGVPDDDLCVWHLRAALAEERERRERAESRAEAGLVYAESAAQRLNRIRVVCAEYVTSSEPAYGLAAAVVALLDGPTAALRAAPAQPAPGMDWSGTTGTVGPRPAQSETLPTGVTPLDPIAEGHDEQKRGHSERLQGEQDGGCDASAREGQDVPEVQAGRRDEVGHAGPVDEGPRLPLVRCDREQGRASRGVDTPPAPGATAPSIFGVGEVPVRDMVLTPAPAPDAHGCPVEGEPGHEGCAVCGHPFPNSEPAPLEEAVRLERALRVRETKHWCGETACDTVRSEAEALLAALGARGKGGE